MAVPSNIHIPDEERIYYGFKAIKQEYFKQINIKIDKKIFFECLFLDIVGLIRNQTNKKFIYTSFLPIRHKNACKFHWK